MAEMGAFAIPETMDSVITEPMAALDQAIKASDTARFTAAYEELTVACNTGHRSGSRRDRNPITGGFSCADQDFRPVKE